MSALEASQDTQTGTQDAEQTEQEAMAVQGAQEAMAGGASCTPARTLLPPPPKKKKKFHGAARGYQEPSGARQTGQDMTGQPTQG